MFFRFLLTGAVFGTVGCALLEGLLKGPIGRQAIFLEFKNQQVLSTKAPTDKLDPNISDGVGEDLKSKAVSPSLSLTGSNNPPVGGLSGLWYDSPTGYFYALSDDKKQHRIYKLSLKTSPQYHFEIIKTLFLKSPGLTGPGLIGPGLIGPGTKLLKRNMDPEALVIYGDTLLIADEGQQIFEEHEPTRIVSFTWPDRIFKKAWPLPGGIFWPKGAKKQTGKLGQRENKGFESLSLNLARQSLWTATEKALYQDSALQVLRLTEFDLNSPHKILSQYWYPLKNPKAGLTALLFLKDKSFLALERAFDKSLYSAQLYLVNCDKAKDIRARPLLSPFDGPPFNKADGSSLKTGEHKKRQKKQVLLASPVKSCSKKPLWNSNSLGFLPDNLEALALVPIKGEAQKKLLILMSDNNFKEGIQKNQVLFFEVLGL